MSAAADAWSAPATAAPFNAATTAGRLFRWRAPSSGPNAVVSASAGELIRRSRDMKRNNPMAKRAMDLLVTHIVGSGIRPRSMCPDLATQKALTKLWDAWTKVSDADGVLDFYGQQMLAVSEMIAGGETFARLRARRLNDGLPVPLQVQLIPTEQVPMDGQTANGTNSITQGIERDAIGARVAYWMYPVHPGDAVPGITGSNNTPAPVPAADVCHIFNATDRIGQLRGLPWLASAMTTLHQINDYMDAELVRKQVAALMVGFLTQGVDEEGQTTPASLAGMGQTTVGADGIPDIVMEPGVMNVLPPGRGVKFNEPADVGGSFDPFLRANYRAVASAAGVLYQELTGDWTEANDRSFRAMFNTFKRQATAWQYNLVCVQFNQPVWDRFIDYAVAAGVIAVPRGMSDADFRAVTWLSDRWAYINPTQDVGGTVAEIRAGLTSRQAEVAARGDDVETVDEQNKADHEREAAMELTYPDLVDAKVGAPMQDGQDGADKPATQEASRGSPFLGKVPTAAYNPNQPRGPGGQWGSGGFPSRRSVFSLVEQVLASRIAGVSATNVRLECGAVASSTSAAIKTISKGRLDTTGYTRVMDTSGVFHAFNNHGNPAVEAARIPPQLAIRKSDLAKVGKIADQGRVTEVRVKLKSASTVTYEATISGRRYKMVEEVRPRAKQLALRSLWKFK